MGCCPSSQMTLWSRGFIRSRGTLKPLYFDYHSAHGYQTWQDGYLPSWAMILRSRGLVRSCDNLKPLNLHYTVPMFTKHDKLVTCHKGIPPIMLLHPFIMWSCGLVRSHDKPKKHCISTATMLMATKQSRVMTYLEWLLPIMSHDHTITWSCNIKWKTKIIIYSLTQCLWLSILAGWGYTMRSFLP